MSEFKEYHNANHHDGDNTFDDQTYKMTNGEEVLNTLNENGYVILPTDELSEEDKKQRKTPNISFIVKSTNLEK